jgi:hypothetical protein
MYNSPGKRNNIGDVHNVTRLLPDLKLTRQHSFEKDARLSSGLKIVNFTRKHLICLLSIAGNFFAKKTRGHQIIFSITIPAILHLLTPSRRPLPRCSGEPNQPGDGAGGVGDGGKCRAAQVQHPQLCGGFSPRVGLDRL